MPNGRGGIVDDMLVYRLAEDKYMLVVNASNRAKDWQWIQDQIQQRDLNVLVTDQSDDVALLAIQGPQADAVVANLKPIRNDGADWNTLDLLHLHPSEADRTPSDHLRHGLHRLGGR